MILALILLFTFYLLAKADEEDQTYWTVLATVLGGCLLLSLL